MDQNNPLRTFRRLLVTGAAGFIGSHFVVGLRQRHPEIEIIALDKLTYAGNLENLKELEDDPGFQFYQGDICDRDLVETLADQVDAIVNFAAETHVDRSLISPYSFIATDVMGVATLCEAAKNYSHLVLLLVSTDEVYGHVSSGRSKEQDQFRPRSPYSASKAGGEMIAWSYVESFGLPLLVTRGSNTYGPNQYPEKIVPLFITNAIEGLTLPVYGTGQAVRDYMHVTDHCLGIETVLFGGEIGQAYNLGSGEETNGLEIARRIVALSDGRANIVFVKDRLGHDYRYALDLTQIGTLGWKAQIGLDKGLQQTYGWYQEHPAWWQKLKLDLHSQFKS